MSKLHLPQVTLVMMGTINLEGHLKALEYSCKDIEFGEVKLITDRPFEHEFIKYNYIDPIRGIDQWSHDIVFKLGEYITTDFALLIHPDGFVVNPESWKSEFLNYDYIGAPWPLPSSKDKIAFRDINGKIQRVGNSVSLRSKKLLDLPKKIQMEWKSFHGFTHEDGYICVNMRHVFEKHGCVFAPLELAVHFSQEVPIPEAKGIKPFAFHKYRGNNKNYPDFENHDLGTFGLLKKTIKHIIYTFKDTMLYK